MDIEKLNQAVRCLKALSHPIRLGILCALREGGKPVLQLAEEMSTTQSNVSQHLANMRERGLLSTERQANQVFYYVKHPTLFDLLDVLKELYCGDNDND
jgi:ArsR family transcriptional regulator